MRPIASTGGSPRGEATRIRSIVVTRQRVASPASPTPLGVGVSTAQESIEEGTAMAQGSGNEKKPQISQGTKLLRLIQAKGLRVFRDANRQAFVLLPVKQHVEVWGLDSQEVEAWLGHCYFAEHRKSIGGQAINEVRRELRHQALFASSEEKVFLRSGEVGRSLFVDLCNDSWDLIQLHDGDWKLTHNPNVYFRRAAGMMSFPLPERGGDVGLIKNYIHFADEDSYYLWLAWTTFCYRPTGAFPLMLLCGEQGRGKSEAAKMTKCLTDPSAAPECTDPDSLRNLAIAAENSWVMFYDNLSYMHQWQQDAFARIATGASFRVRKLHTGREEELFHAKRPVIVTSILDVVTQSDLMQRSIHINLAPLEGGKRISLETLWSAFAQDLPLLFGALLSLAAKVAKRFRNVAEADLERMGDFHRWLIALERILELPRGRLTEAYRRNLEYGRSILAEQNGLYPAVLEFMRGKLEWRGSATDLLPLLSDCVLEKNRGSDWPRSPKALGKQLQRLAPTLKTAGITAEKTRDGKSREWILHRTDYPQTSQTSQTDIFADSFDIPQKIDIPD